MTGDSWKEFLESLPDTVRQEVRDLHRAYDRGFISYEEFRRTAVEVSKASSDIYDQIFIQRPDHQKNQPLFKYLKTLKNQYKLSVLSNVGSPWIRDSFLSPDEVALFDDMVLSFEVGLGKPDPEVYQLACRRLGIAPEEAVFVDDLAPYCEVARRLGMEAVQYKNFSQCKRELEEILTNSN
jgi:epoxide hydrolase-like predicted phosphatase